MHPNNGHKPQIPQEYIDSIKQTVDLVPLMQSCGLELKQVGSNYQGFCPFHEDSSSPSLTVNPDENLWNCFGCEAGGDNIRFVQLFNKISFNKAVDRLKGFSGKSKKTKSPAPKTELAVKEKKLLARVVNYYQHTFGEDSRGLDYLKERGITDHQAIKDFGAGLVTGSLRDILPQDEDVTKTLKELGILNKKGNEIFYNSVVFPLYDQDGGVVNLYGRNISEENQVNHLYLAGSRQGLINRQALKRSTTIILTESIIDALTLYDQGFKNVIPVYGVNGLTDDHLSLFNRSKAKDIYIVFDADKAGKQGAAKTAKQLQELNITTHLVTLPDKDINIFFNRHTPEEFENLLKEANPASCEQSEKLNKRKKTLFVNDQHGFTVGYGQRQYQVKGIQRGDTQLKATIKVSKDVKDSKQPFELTTIDLYSSRSRVWFAKLCAGLLAEPDELIKEDLGKLMALVENYQPPEEKEESVEISTADKQLAIGFLKSPEMFSELLADFQTMGVTGEETNKLVGYLAATVLIFLWCWWIKAMARIRLRYFLWSRRDRRELDG